MTQHLRSFLTKLVFATTVFGTLGSSALFACDCDEPSSDEEKVIVLEKEGSDSVTYKMKFLSKNIHLNTTSAYFCHPSDSKITSLTLKMIKDFNNKPHGHGTTPVKLALSAPTCTTIANINFLPKHKMSGYWTATAKTVTGKVTFDLTVDEKEK
jgi:hypothetical protein